MNDVVTRERIGTLSVLGNRAIPVMPGTPLIVAIHGGTYSATYFDVPGHSLLARAGANGLSAIAIDRPG